MDGWRRPVGALGIIMTVAALLLVVLGLMKEPSWFAGNGGNQTSSTITIADNDNFVNKDKSTEKKLPSLSIISQYNVLKAAKDYSTSPDLFLNVTDEPSVGSSHGLSSHKMFPRTHAILPHQSVDGYHEASVSSDGANDGKPNDSLIVKTNSEKERALMFGLTVADSDAAPARQISLNAAHKRQLDKEVANISEIEHLFANSYWQKPRLVAVSYQTGNKGHNWSNVKNSIPLKRHKRLGKRLLKDNNDQLKNISDKLQVLPVSNTYKSIRMRISKKTDDTLSKAEHPTGQVASVNRTPKAKIRLDVYLGVQGTRSIKDEYIQQTHQSSNLNVKNVINDKFQSVQEQEFKNTSDSMETTVKNSNNVDMTLPKKRTQRMSYCSADEYCLKQGYLLACRQNRCQPISPPAEGNKRETIRTPHTQNIESNTNEKLDFDADYYSKHPNNNHPFGYSPYSNKELPKIPNYPLKPSFTQDSRLKFPPHTLPLLVIITVVMFIIFVVLAVVCAVKLVTSSNTQREEREHILGRGARPKTTRDFSSSSSSTNSGGRSRPPSYRAVAPPNYTQAQEQLRIPDATNTDVSGNQPPGTRPEQNETFRDGTMPLRYSSAGDMISSRNHLGTNQVNEVFRNVSGNADLSRESVGERSFNPPRLSSGTDDSFISADDFDSVSMKSEAGIANRSHDIVRKVSSGPKGIHEPIYEEVFEEDDCRSAKSLPSGIERYAATAPMYENISSKSGIAKSVDSLKQDDQVIDRKGSNIVKENKPFNNDSSKISSVAKEIQNQPEYVTKKLIENQAQINNLMNELTKQIVKQKSKGSLYGERKSIQDSS